MHTVKIIGTNHPLDPPVGIELTVIRTEPDAVIVNWDPNAWRSSGPARNAPKPASDRPWPMLREHVRPGEGDHEPTNR